jgi:hypothetical protein
LDAFTRAAGHLRRILETLGIERRTKDAKSELIEYFQERARADRDKAKAAAEAAAASPMCSPDVPATPATPNGDSRG